MTTNEPVGPVFLYEEEMPRYAKLVVPSSMRSSYWKHFGFPADEHNNIITKQKIVCCICRQFITYNKNTTNLSSHLFGKHANMMTELYPEQLTNMSDKIKAKKCSKLLKRENSDAEETVIVDVKRTKNIEALNDLDTVWLVDEGDDSKDQEKDENAPETNNVFQINKDMKVIIMPKNNCEIADELNTESDQYLEVESDENYGKTGSEEMIHRIEEETNSIEFLNEEFLAVSNENEDIAKPATHTYCKKSSSKRTKRDDTSGEDAQFINLVDKMKNFLIKDFVRPQVIDGDGFKEMMKHLVLDGKIPNSSEVTKSIEIDYNQRYSAFMLQTKQILGEQKYSISLNKLGHRTNFQVTINYLSSNSHETNNLEQRTIAVSADVLALFRTIKNELNNCSAILTNFDFTEDFDAELYSFVNDNEIPIVQSFSSVLDDAIYECLRLPEVENVMRSTMPNHGPENWHKQFEHLSNLAEKCNKNIENQSNTASVPKIIVEYLEPLKNCLDVLVSVNTAFVSIMKPIASELIHQHYLVPEFNDESISPLAKEIKRIISEKLQSKIVDNKFLAISTFMDPRFQSSTTPEDLKLIRTKFEELMQIQSVDSPVKTADAKQISVKSEKSFGLSSLFSTFRGVSKPKQSKNRIDIEFRSYTEDATLDMDRCPLAWWSEHDYLYPTIKQQVKRYFCVPSFSDDMHRLSLERQSELKNKYAAIISDIDRKQYWLHLNAA